MRRRPERVRGASSCPRRRRPGVEYLEDRRLLSAITEFPLTGGLAPAELVVGPDGDLWFPEYHPLTHSLSPPSGAIGRITPAGALTEFPIPEETDFLTIGPDGDLWFSGSGAIGRITPAGAVTEFPLPAGSDVTGALTVGPDGDLWFPGSGTIGRITPAGAVTEFPLPAGSEASDALTVGPDGDLWFPDLDGAIGRVDLADLANSPGSIGGVDPNLPHVTQVIAAAHSRKAITSILIGFDEPLDPASVTEVRFYSLAPGVERGHKLVIRKGVKIARVSYDATAQTVRLKLAVPQKGPIRVTVHAGIVAADGISSASDFTAVVTESHARPGLGEADPLRRDAALGVELVRPAAESG
jgi:hypothetical protein